MNFQVRKGSAFGATLFIIGTCVGAGIISVPIATGIGGFIPALVLNLVIGLSTMATALLYAEVILSLPDGSNLLTATEQAIGPFIRYLAGFCLIFLFTSLFTAYFFEGGSIITHFFKMQYEILIPIPLSVLIIALFFGVFVFLGMWTSARLNFVLIVGLITSYIFILISGSEHVFQNYLIRYNWILILFSAPLIFLSYAFSAVIPSLVTYVKRNPRQIRWAIVIGASIPIVLACLWQAVVIGALSEGTIWEAYESGNPLSESLLLIKRVPWLHKSARFFAFFALITSLLGNSLGIVDFLSDGFSIPLEKRIGKKRLFIVLLAYIPPLFFALVHPMAFLKTLEYIAGFGEALLGGLIPVWMVWNIRYRQKISSPRLLPGGRVLLLALLFFILFIIYLQGLEVVNK